MTRITQPLVRQPNGELKPVSWEVALDYVGKEFRERRDTRGGKSIGVIGSNRITNEEAYLLQKFARTVLGTNNIDHHRTADYVSFAQALAGHKRPHRLRCATPLPHPRSLSSAATQPSRPRALRGIFAPTSATTAAASTSPTPPRSSSAARRSPSCAWHRSATAHLPPTLRATQRLLPKQPPTPTPSTRSATPSKPKRSCSSSSAPSCAAKTSRHSSTSASRSPAQSSHSSPTTPTRAAQPTWVFCRTCCPATRRSQATQPSPSTTRPATPGLDLLEIFEAAGRGELSALYVVGSNPVARYGVDPESLKDTFVVVQDMFLTETAALADVILPAANLYEKSGSVTNSYGDLQLVSKAGDRAGVRTDFEMIVRIADKMGANMHALVPFGKGTRADMGQSRGAQSGEADRHAVWLTANNLEPKLSPFDPFAILDEIQRLVPGYNLLRLQLLSGNDQHLQPAAPAPLVQIGSRRDLVLPANDSLFTSGTLGRYSAMLSDLQHNESLRPPTGLTQIETAAD